MPPGPHIRQWVALYSFAMFKRQVHADIPQVVLDLSGVVPGGKSRYRYFSSFSSVRSKAKNQPLHAPSGSQSASFTFSRMKLSKRPSVIQTSGPEMKQEAQDWTTRKPFPANIRIRRERVKR